MPAGGATCCEPSSSCAARGPRRGASSASAVSTRRAALVTGGSSGIGAAIARRLAGRGWHCVLVARGEERLRRVAEELGTEYEICDVGDREAVERMAASVRERHPALGLLVCSAGISGRRRWLETEPERVEQITRVNYLGSLWCLRALLPALEAGRPSHVVNVVSVAGTVAAGRSGPYTASKHAQLALSRGVTVELAPRGIHCHTVNPGFVETEGFPQQRFLHRPLLRRLVIEPDDVADAVLRAIDRNLPEVFVPPWYRIAGIAQAILPGTLSRLLARRAAP